MHLPLDLYRILGIPPQSDAELIEQAYHDRLAQLPRQEFSDSAITIRNQIITTAYSCLSDTVQRQAYDSRWWGSENATGEEPNFDCDPEQIIGALLVWLELAEYEMVLTWGKSALEFTNRGNTDTDTAQTTTDIRLCLALAYWELSREYWQQQQYESAATASLKSLTHLPKKSSFSALETEIRQEHYKLRPYRIQAAFTQFDQNTDDSTRQQGLTLIREMITDRKGIEGSGQDFSGLGNDDFLKFINQLRPQLTVEEQISLFLPEIERSSDVAVDISIQALIVQGIKNHAPSHIIEAKKIAAAAKKCKDLMLKIAVCDLLLGQTSLAIEKSSKFDLCQEASRYNTSEEDGESIADPLNQFYIAAQRWLHKAILPQFLNINAGQLSLDNYFNDPAVQKHLETFYSDFSTEPQILNPDLTLSPDTDSPMAHSLATYHDEHHSSRKLRSRRHRLAASRDHMQMGASSVLEAPRESSIAVDNLANSSSSNLGHTMYTSESYPSPFSPNVPATKSSEKKRNRKKRYTINPVRFGLFLAIVFGSFSILGWLTWQRVFSPVTNLTTDTIAVSIDTPIDLIPDQSATKSLLLSEPGFNQEVGKVVIETWLASKRDSFGKERDLSGLKQILMPSQFNKQIQRIERDKARNRYQKYEHSVVLKSYTVNPNDPNQAEVVARIQETRTTHAENSSQAIGSPEVDDLMVRYQLVRNNDLWKIDNIQVISGE